MNSNFLSKIGLSNFDIGYLFLILFIVAIVLLVLLIVALVQIHSFKNKYQNSCRERMQAAWKKILCPYMRIMSLSNPVWKRIKKILKNYLPSTRQHFKN